jgi:hypothetical protein
MKNAPLDLTAVAGSALAREVGQGACKKLLVSSHMKSFFSILRVEISTRRRRKCVFEEITNRGEGLRTSGDS